MKRDRRRVGFRPLASIAAMLRAKPIMIGLVLSASAALAGCGSSDPEPSIPLESAQTLIGTLREVEANVDAGSCVEELKAEIEELPSEINDDVRQGLENGADQLGILINDPDQCERPEVETTTEETTAPETTTEETTTEETTTEQTQPTEPTTPTNPGGGVGPPGGGQGGL
jgi:hypothetical protein